MQIGFGNLVRKFVLSIPSWVLSLNHLRAFCIMDRHLVLMHESLNLFIALLCFAVSWPFFFFFSKINFIKRIDIKSHVGSYKCACGRCRCCGYVISVTFISTNTNITYPIKHVNCNSTYVVYLITCILCHMQYVGSTSCTLKTCICRHLSD